MLFTTYKWKIKIAVRTGNQNIVIYVLYVNKESIRDNQTFGRDVTKFAVSINYVQKKTG